jgi:hypothetical protein
MTPLSPEAGRCPNCSVSIRQDHPHVWCSECGNGLPEELRPNARLAPAVEHPQDSGPPRVLFRDFRSSFLPWSTLFAEAGAFATQVGRARLISISHSADRSTGVVTVWYWSA